jgi:hypothetical protein
MTEKVRNAVREQCDGCGREVVYEKDEDSGLDSIETSPGVWEQLCEKCARQYKS